MVSRATATCALALLAALAVAGCSDSFLWGKECDPREGCLPGYVCDPATNRCVRPAELDGSDGGDIPADKGPDAGNPDAGDPAGDTAPDGGDPAADIPADDGGPSVDASLDAGDGDDTGDGGNESPECNTTRFDDVELDGEGDLLVVDPGDEVEVSLEAVLTRQAGCPDCGAQLLFGLYAPGYWHQPIHCVDAGVLPPCPEPHDVRAWFTLTAPRTPGDYLVLAARAQDAGCAGAMEAYLGWLGGDPFELATVRVRQPACKPWQVVLTDVRLDGAGPRVEVAPGTEVSFSAEFFASQMSGCPDCIDQIVVGIGGDAQVCHDMRIIEGCPQGERGTITGTLTAPDSSGVVQVRYGLYAHYDCEGAMQWYRDDPPGRGWTAGVILVR